MKSLFELLGFRRSPSEETAGDTETVRKIVRELEALPEERARFVAAFAYVLGRVAHADLDISAEETGAMEDIVRQYGQLPAEQAVLVVQIAKAQNRLFGGTESFQVTRELKSIATKEQCEEILHSLFAVSAADHSISAVEEAEIRRIAEELGFSHRELVQVRSHYNDKRSVIQKLEGR